MRATTLSITLTPAVFARSKSFFRFVLCLLSKIEFVSIAISVGHISTPTDPYEVKSVLNSTFCTLLKNKRIKSYFHFGIDSIQWEWTNIR